MTYAPKRLLELHEYLKDEAGLPANALGIVGNPKIHFGGYHCQGDCVCGFSTPVRVHLVGCGDAGAGRGTAAVNIEVFPAR